MRDSNLHLELMCDLLMKYWRFRFHPLSGRRLRCNYHCERQA